MLMMPADQLQLSRYGLLDEFLIKLLGSRRKEASCLSHAVDLRFGFHMASLRGCDLRMLVAVVCGLLTTVVFGLGVWRTVIRIQKEISPSSPNIPTDLCKNGGSWMNGRCICTNEWRGLRCTISRLLDNTLSITVKAAQRKTLFLTKFQWEDMDIPGKRVARTLKIGKPMATRLCSFNATGEITLGKVNTLNCNETLEDLAKKVQNATNIDSISADAQILTSVASTLNSDDISFAADVATQLLDTSRNISHEAQKNALTTVSQLLDAKETVFEEAATKNQSAFTTLVEQMETFSVNGNQSVVEPNIVIQSVAFSEEFTDKPTSVRFSVVRGSSKSFDAGSTYVEKNVNSLNMKEQTEIQILLSTSNNKSTQCGFVVYQNNKFFQSKTFKTHPEFSQKIISSTTREDEENQITSVGRVFRQTEENEANQSTFVDMAVKPDYNSTKFEIYSYACVYWNLSMNDWDTYGCHKSNSTDQVLQCRCNHTTNFAVLMSFKRKYEYPESLHILSKVGCGLSITGLVLTIIFQILTRNGRKTSVTWVLVSLCTSMLIFNLLFVFGIENSNKKNNTQSELGNKENKMLKSDRIPTTPNPKCTVIAALLHYFLLVTFTWTGLSATQLYFLLIRTMKPLPRYFILFVSLVGWGVPAIVVAVTVGTTYAVSQDPDWELEYREEKFCWLKSIHDDSLAKSPFFWSFIMPVTIILIGNVAIFIIITVKVMWKNNQNLTSTKKFSHLKKIISTMSIAVIFGITWILGYLMLIEDDSMFVFSYIFCLFNSTQGLQIFILHTVRTKIFQSEACKVLKLISSSVQRVKLRQLSMPAPLRLNLRMYNMLRVFPTLNERFRLLDPSVITEETTIDESSSEN
ncbi:Adhesion G-protein coupled receptor G7 [Galemys pyrenaicus]|uniref:Adhesion G-protein coupled receptor G7 n=1 Tax=Galemys pyrenaicus TaxID=202257 RepID=A0A8J5ZYX1_GALPY|nr:Adhesion G-protein coupled receptor G7 [Galemys pyrenaicus]